MSNVEESTISSVSTTILQGDACNGNIGIHSAGTPVGFSVSPAPALTLYFASNARSADTVTLFLVSRAAVEQFGAILRAGGLAEVTHTPSRNEWRSGDGD